MNERYSHTFHAGNVGDVWKHTVLTALVTVLRREGRPLLVIETHAGAGRYELGPTGEWTEGIGKLWSSPPEAPEALRRYLELAPAPSGGERSYPGSPVLSMSLLGAADRAVLCELEPPTAQLLKRVLAGDPRADVRATDGLAALPDLLAAAGDGETLVIIDPPYSLKEDWITVPEALIAAYRQRPATRFLLWYALKSYTRPNAVLERLGKAGLPAVAMELITTPLELQKNRLNGSGVLLVGAPAPALEESAAAAPVLGRLCATHQGRFTTRTVGWSEPWSK